MSLVLLILGLLLFVGLVVVHEFGHFLVARRSGVEVEEFAIGFPPTIYSKKTKGNFKFSVNLLPLGGFVRLKGEHDADKTPGSFGAAPLRNKIKIMLAGIAMNLAMAFLIFTFLALIGMPKLFDNQFNFASNAKVIQQVKNKGVVLISHITESSPAVKAGLKENDQIVSLNGSSVTSPTQLAQLTKAHAGEKVSLTIKRTGDLQNVSVQLNAPDQASKGYLGVVTASGEQGIELTRYTWSAPVVAGGLISQFTQLTYKGLSSAVAGLFRGNAAAASDQVSGPVGIFVILKEGSALGINFILMVIGILSLTLALINVLPVPALDGGRLFVTLLFRAIKKPLKQRTEEWIHGTGFALLMLLFVLITIVDIHRIR